MSGLRSDSTVELAPPPQRYLEEVCPEVLEKEFSGHPIERGKDVEWPAVFGDAKMTAALLDRLKPCRFLPRSHHHRNFGE